MTIDVEKRAPFGPFSVSPAGIKKSLIDFLGSMGVISQNHKKIHEENFYTAAHTFLAVADDASVLMRVKTNTKDLHMAFSVIAEGKAYVNFEHGTTFSAPGTELTPQNNTIGSSNTADFKAFFAPTVNVAGTSILPSVGSAPATGILVSGGLGPQSVGSDVKQDEEWEIEEGIESLITVTNKSGQAKDITVLIAGYED